MTNRAEFERLLDVYGFRCERFGQDLSTHARAQVVSAFAALANAPAGERVPHRDQPQQTGVGEWCAPGPAAEQRRAWLLRFADTERGDCIYYDEQEARRSFAQAEGRGWNCYLFEFARRAPVAGEATKLVVVPDAIRLMAQRIAADDFEHCTADPIFTVQRRDQITGLDLDYDCEVGWFHDGDQITGDKAAALEAAYQESCTVPDDYTRTGIAETWEHFATYVTMEAAQEFVAKKGPKYRVYVDSGCRNHEWKALRALLLQIADASYLLAAPQASEAVRTQVLAALESAQRFIRNGIEFGYIRMPDADTPDPAHRTPSLIDAAIRSLKTQADKDGGQQRAGDDCKHARVYRAGDRQGYACPDCGEFVSDYEIHRRQRSALSATQPEQGERDE